MLQPESRRAAWHCESSLTLLDFNFLQFKARVLDEVVSKVSFIQKRHSTHWIKQPVPNRYRPVNSGEPEPTVTRNWETFLCIQALPFTKVKREMTGTFQAVFVLMMNLMMYNTQMQEKVQKMLHLFETWGGKDKKSAFLTTIKNQSVCVSCTSV